MDPLAHASMGLIAKPLAPKAPLWALLGATQVIDVLSIGLIAAGIEHGAETKLDFEHGLQYLSPPSIAWSDSLMMALVWSVMVALIALLVWRDRRTGVVMGLLVFSHWVLDTIVYLYVPVFLSNEPTIGFGLITSGPGLIAGIILEIVLIIGGAVVYFATRKRRSAPVPS